MRESRRFTGAERALVWDQVAAGESARGIAESQQVEARVALHGLGRDDLADRL